MHGMAQRNSIQLYTRSNYIYLLPPTFLTDKKNTEQKTEKPILWPVLPEDVELSMLIRLVEAFGSDTSVNLGLWTSWPQHKPENDEDNQKSRNSRHVKLDVHFPLSGAMSRAKMRYGFVHIISKPFRSILQG